jgi:hypothetical protein
MVAEYITHPEGLQLPQILHNLARSYFRERTPAIHTNSTQIERDVNNGCPQGSCCRPGFWNIQYNSLLNLSYGKRTKAIAFADDLLIAVRAENVQEAEKFANIEIGKIKNWGKENNITFNEQKSKVMLVTRRKEVNVYLPSLMMKVPNHLYVLGDTYTCHTYCCYAYLFTRIGCTLFTCDMYMYRLRLINDSVLSSLKMEGMRLLY